MKAFLLKGVGGSVGGQFPQIFGWKTRWAARNFGCPEDLRTEKLDLRCVYLFVYYLFTYCLFVCLLFIFTELFVGSCINYVVQRRWNRVEGGYFYVVL